MMDVRVVGHIVTCRGVPCGRPAGHREQRYAGYARCHSNETVRRLATGNCQWMEVGQGAQERLKAGWAKGGGGGEEAVEDLKKQEGDKLTVAIARRELRAWLRMSEEGTAVEDAVERLLGGR